MEYVRIKVDIQGMPEFVMEINVPDDRDKEEYIDEFLDTILSDNARYDADWEFD